jgi:hypothetical protein
MKKKYFMRKCVIIIITLMTLVSCSKNKTCVIEGVLYGGGKFEGEWIYLESFVGTSDTRDSAVIHDGRFRFEGTVEEDEVCILRMRPMMRLFIQELIFIREPGHVRTLLSKVSSVKGTPQNDSLQNWNVHKQKVDEQFQFLSKKMKKAEGEEYTKLTQQYDSLKLAFDEYNEAVVSRNNNAFGNYIDKFFN